MAMGDSFDLQVVRRMMELQIRLMSTDWRREYRNPCSLQPNGRREYHVTRRTQDRSVKAVMFPLTGIIELFEEVYRYYCLTKDLDFVQKHLKTLEGGAARIQNHVDGIGRLWSDVYYEDQVIKDGATVQAQAFAIHSLRLLARLESLAGNSAQEQAYDALAEKMRQNYIRPLPDGYWDTQNGRYVDWIDRNGKVHDHIHLLGNALSVTYGINPIGRDRQVHQTIAQNDDIFQKFPSFVAAKIEDYTRSEIGSGGPYDLCAAGRYWCHDAKYRKACGDAAILLRQLTRVAEEAEHAGYLMGERYDMNYIYYNTGEDGTRNWHGSPQYYEYPNVFLDVLIHDFLGIEPDESCDLCLCPCCTDGIAIELESFGIRYTFSVGIFTLTNCSPKNLRIRFDLHNLFTDWDEKKDGGEFLLPSKKTVEFRGTPRTF